MLHKVCDKWVAILVQIYQGDMHLCLNVLPNLTSEAAFNAFYSRWFLISYVHSYVLVDRGSNLVAELIKQKLHEIEAKFCPIPTEAP